MTENIRTLLTIITEASLESTLTRELERLGAHGYTITDARGKGRRGVRDAEFDAESNIRVEVICGEQTAAAITRTLRERYYGDYAMIMFTQQVTVMRPEKF